MGSCLSAPVKEELYNIIPVMPVLSTCCVCRKKNPSSPLCFVCENCKAVLGHKSCIKYRILVNPNCPYCKEML